MISYAPRLWEMEFVYLDFAAAWAYCTKTGRGGDELKAARDRMQNHADYAVARHLEALALAEDFRTLWLCQS